MYPGLACALQQHRRVYRRVYRHVLAYRQQMPYYRDYTVMAYVVMACVVMAVHGLRVQAAEQSTVAAYSYGAL